MAAADSKEQGRPVEPRGFGERSRGLASEYAHEQGWGLDEEERRKQPVAAQDTDGGTDYEYGARDFGDSPVNTDIAPEERDKMQNAPAPGDDNKEEPA